MHAALVMLGYGALTALAVWSVWRSYEARPVGVAIAGSFVASNLAHLLLQQGERPSAYTVCEAAVMSMAFLAHVAGASRILILVVATAAVSIASNLAISTYPVVTRDQIVLWETFTNACFIVECLLLVALGLKERAGSRVGASDGRDATDLYVGAARTTETER